MRVTLEKAGIAADADGIVLLEGESGSGKDYLARWIHDHSRRVSGPFFSINCAALPRELAESELFGHERGSFTGATGLKRGMLELAEGGTILLNEIGELDLSLQSKLLAFLDTLSFLRVGGQKHVNVNARLIAASHRDLKREVTEGRFLRPLFYRLSVFPIHVPALRERIEDIPTLVRSLLAKLAVEMQLSEIPLIEPADIEVLSRYDWPGNVRELRNVLERSLMLSRGTDFTLALPATTGQPARNGKRWSHTVTLGEGRTLPQVTDEVIRSLCTEVLSRCGGRKKEAARLLGISRGALYRYLKRLGIEHGNGTRA
jgi:DNA-binding NtrC family response regulator